jgi:2,4-dienoyl-CoA reductase-like NADH-dependent reductase (Old Yellow Enzyme family)
VRLTDPLPLAGRTASSRVLLGPHETNLGHRRELSPRHVAYYARRAAGGAGVVVTGTASVHRDDWPYERAPLAADCGPGWLAGAGRVVRAGDAVAPRTVLVAVLEGRRAALALHGGAEVDRCPVPA